MLVIAFHEFGHAIMCVLTGGKVKSIELDPREGGVTHMLGGRSALTLPAGYLGSSLVGALLTFAGFNINASKIASIAVGVCFLLTLWWGRRDWLTIGTILAAVGLLVGCWFIAHAEALRFVVLFIGVMSSLYSVWDIVSYPPFLVGCWVGARSHFADHLWRVVRRPHPPQDQQLRRERLC
jgi:Zn-dependent protease with chaperone function